jgi:murein DD-endopeptidase MepM/ murein hydrolase activator NlpD
VSGDGRRIVRLHLPRWLPYGALAGLVLPILALGLTWGDDVSLGRHRGQLAARPGVSDEQERLIETVRRRLTDIQTEMAAWRSVHARIWEPLGPEAPGLTERSGIGGVGQPVVGRDGPEGLVLQLEQLATTVGDEGLKLRALERLMARAGKVLAALPTRWPVRGTVNSEFGRRLSPWTGSLEHHGGLDIAAEIGTPVEAPAPGVVTFAGSALDFGHTVVIDHGHDIKTLFGHLQKIQVAVGQQVERGQQIALSGNSGRSSGPHLHYEITVRGQSVNPRGYLWD